MAAWPRGERWLPQASHLDAVSIVLSGVGTGLRGPVSESPERPSLSLLGPLISGGPVHSRVTVALRGSSKSVCGQVGSEGPPLELGDLAGAAPRAPRPVRRREGWSVASSPA